MFILGDVFDKNDDDDDDEFGVVVVLIDGTEVMSDDQFSPTAPQTEPLRDTPSALPASPLELLPDDFISTPFRVGGGIPGVVAAPI